jgi:hypothetical protein
MCDCLEIWEPQPSGALRVCPGLYRVCFTFIPLINLDKYFVAHLLFFQALQQYMFNLFIPQNMNDSFLYPFLLHFPFFLQASYF